MKQVKVAPGFSNVPIAGGVYNQGQLIHLTDSQYAALPIYVLAQIVVVSTSPDPTDNYTTQPDQNAYTNQLVNDSLISLAVPAYLVWDGSDYQPSQFKASVSRPKVFVGPVDPHGFSGVILAVRDQWINN